MNPQEDGTIKRNIDEGVKLVCFLIRKRMNMCPDYPVPMTEAQMNAADAIIQGIQSSSVTSLMIHQLLYSIFSEEVLDSSDIRFNHPMERFLILFSRKTSGDGWRNLHDLSSALVRLQWCIRTTIIYDAYIHEQEYHNKRNGSVFFMCLFHQQFELTFLR